MSYDTPLPSQQPLKNKTKTRHLTKNSTLENQDVTSYKNENVLFQIHSPTNSETYNAKNFPAKFSINITNQSNQLTSGAYDIGEYQTQNTDRSRFDKKKANGSYQMLPDNQNGHKRVNTGNKKDASEYEEMIKKYRDQYEQIIQESQENCDRYENCIRQLQNQLNDRGQKIQELQMIINQYAKRDEQVALKIQVNSQQMRELQNNYVKLVGKYDKCQQKIRKSEENQRQINSKYQQLKQSFEEVMTEKQLLIKKLNEVRNETYLQMMKEQKGIIGSEVRKMEKWLTSFNESFHADKKLDQDKDNLRYKELLQKYELLKTEKQNLKNQVKNLNSKIKEKTSVIEKIESQKENIRIYIKQLEEERKDCREKHCLENQTKQKQKTQTFRPIPEFTLDGTVKVKMNLLLHQKDKRINCLQEQLRDCKTDNMHLNNQIQKLEYELRSFDYSNRSQLCRMKSEPRLQECCDIYHQPSNYNQFKEQRTSLNNRLYMKIEDERQIAQSRLVSEYDKKLNIRKQRCVQIKQRDRAHLGKQRKNQLIS